MKILETHLFTIFGFLLAILFIARLMRERRHPGSTMAWLMGIVLIPHIGIPFYFLFGGKKIRYMIKKKDNLYQSNVDNDILIREYMCNTERILVKSGVPPAINGNQIELLHNGMVAYSRLMELLEKAEHSIDITTFILGRDDVGEAIIEVLAKKARQGVNVRLILDSLGCIWTKGRFVNPLRKAGGKIGIFMPMLPFHRKWSANLRNHRKIVIVDKSSAIMGGMNLASEYMGPEYRESRWHDFDVMVNGPLVVYMCQIFDADWYFATGKERPSELQESSPYIFSKINMDVTDIDDISNIRNVNDVTAQVAASGPDVQTDVFYEAILTSILEAKERVWIISPYFIPDEPFLKSFALLSRWDKDVRIIVPARSNHFLADLARGSYLRTLAETGVKIYYFQSGMLHSKIILIDQSIAILGSANMDFRSLYLNYEIALFIYSSSQVNAIEGIIKRDILPQTEPVRYEGHSYKNEIREWAEDISRVLSPFL